MTSVEPQAINLKLLLSRRLALVLMAIHLIALIATFWFYFPWWLRLLFCLWNLVSFYYYWQRYYRLVHSSSVIALEGRGREWLATMASGRQTAVLLQPGTIVTAWFMMLQFRCAYSRKRFVVILFSDSADGEKQRQLRVMLLQLSASDLRNNSIFS